MSLGGSSVKWNVTEVAVKDLIDAAEQGAYCTAGHSISADLVHALERGFPVQPIYCSREDSGALKVLIGSQTLNSLVHAHKQNLVSGIMYRKLLVIEIILEEEPESVLTEVVDYLKNSNQ